MSTLVIDAPLAERIRSIAEQEKRPVEVILEAMVEQYNPAMGVEEIYAHLRAMDNSGITPPSPIDENIEDWLSEDEEAALIQRAGAGDMSGSQMVIEERKQGW